MQKTERHVSNDAKMSDDDDDIDLRQYVTLRRFFDDDPFFDEGNEQRAYYLKCCIFQLSSTTFDTNTNTNTDIDIDIDTDAMMNDDDAEYMYCCIDECQCRFRTTAEYASHYAVQHRHRCATCSAVLPNHRLLDMHVAERHDSYFAAMAARRPSYNCLVESCSDLFQSAHARSIHLRLVHMFPKNFCYDRQKRTRAQRKTKTKITGTNINILSQQMSKISFGRTNKNRSGQQQQWSKNRMQQQSGGQKFTERQASSFDFDFDTQSTTCTTFGDLTKGGAGSTASSTARSTASSTAAKPKLNRRERRALARAQQQNTKHKD